MLQLNYYNTLNDLLLLNNIQSINVIIDLLSRVFELFLANPRVLINQHLTHISAIILGKDYFKGKTNGEKIWIKHSIVIY